MQNSPSLSALLGDHGSIPEGARRATHVLALLSNPHRLRVLCHLTEEGRLSVSELVARVGLSPSALSQHLAKLREEGLVRTHKERQQVFYRVERPDVKRLLALLHELYCQPGQ